MAIFHCQIKSLSRSSGRSAIAASAYRTGDKLIDNQDGTIHDYTRRSGVVMDQLILPGNMSANTSERNHLWNVAELAEKRKNARTAREYEIALPSELSEVQRGNLAQAFSKLLADRYGVAIDLAIHSPSKEGDKRNHHAHLLATTRQVKRAPNGDLILRDKASIELSDKKRRELNLGTASDEIIKVRKLWEELANQHLKLAGQTENIDSRSLADQGIDRIPTQHLGPTATAIERRTKQWSHKRINQLLERKKQIENAREEKILAKEYKETEKLIINLSSELQTAKIEHQEHTTIESGLQDIWAAFDQHEQEKVIAAERLAKKEELERKRKIEERKRKNRNQSRRGYSR